VICFLHSCTVRQLQLDQQFYVSRICLLRAARRTKSRKISHLLNLTSQLFSNEIMNPNLFLKYLLNAFIENFFNKTLNIRKKFKTAQNCRSDFLIIRIVVVVVVVACMTFFLIFSRCPNKRIAKRQNDGRRLDNDGKLAVFKLV